MAESALQRAERIGMALALRAVREIRPMQGLPVTDADGTMRHGFSVINKAPISSQLAATVLVDHMKQVVESLRPHVAELLTAQPEADTRLKPIYTVGELLGVDSLLRPTLWESLMEGNWRAAAGEIMTCTRPAYMEASKEIQAKVNDVIFDMVTGV